MQIILWLPPGEAKEVTFFLGQGSNRAESVRLIRRYQDMQTVQTAWKDVIEFWDNLLGTVQVDTPDPAINLIFNRWLLYQTSPAGYGDAQHFTNPAALSDFATNYRTL